MRLVDSSEPGAVERDKAWWLLTERTVLTSSVCRELLHSVHEEFADRRSRAALDLLRRWVGERYDRNAETHPGDGVHSMVVPPGAECIHEELVAGVKVCEALAMLWTADTDRELQRDAAEVRRSLHAWQWVVEVLQDADRDGEAGRLLGRYSLRLVRRRPDRSIDRWTILGQPGQWSVQHRPNSGYGVETFRSDLDTVEDVVGDTPDLNAVHRGVTSEFRVADDVDVRQLAEMLIGDAREGSEQEQDWPADLASWWADTTPYDDRGLPWVDRWVAINGERFSMLWADGASIVAPAGGPTADLLRTVDAMRRR